MKRFTSFFAAMMLMLIGAPVFAQTSGCLDELKNQAITVGEVVEAFEPGTWYLLYQSRDGGGYLCDHTAGGRLQKSTMTFLTDGDVTSEKACVLVRFIEGEGEQEEVPAYYVQFGTGNWVGQGTAPVQPFSVESKDDALMWNVHVIEGDELGHYSFTLDAADGNGSRIDNDSHTNNWGTISYWENGPGTSQGSNYDWQFYSVELNETDSVEVMMTRVTNRFTELIEYYDAFEPGTEPGQYDPTAVQNFQAALDLVAETLDDPEFVPTVASLQAMLDLMNTTYEAVLKSKVKFQPASGWYFLYTNGVDYQETLPDTEDPETGEPIPGETISVPKGMYATATAAGWKTLVDSTMDATFLWRFDLDAETGYYKVYNAAWDSRFVQSGQTVTMSTTADPVESEMEIFLNSKDEETGNLSVTFRRADQTGDYQFLHQGGHNNGAGKSGNVVGWTQTPGASQWRMETVDDATAQQLIDAFAPVKDRQKLCAAYDSIKAVAVAELAIAEDLTIEKENFLVTDASQLSSEYTDPTEGSIEGAVDGDFDTFWHSTWQGGSVPNGTHYLQFNLEEPLSGGVALYYVRRNAQADQSLRFSIYASETGEGDKSEWTKLGEVSFNDNRTVKVPVYSTGFMFTGEYSYFRAYMEESTNNRGYWHCAEMNLVPVVQNPNCQAAHMGNLYTDLKFVLNEQQDVTHETLTLEQYNDLKEALDAFNTKFVDPTPLRNAITEAEPKSALVAEGTDPGYWPAGTSVTELTTVIGNAKTYDESGDYTPAQSEQYITNINAAVETLFAQANKIQTGKWYQFQFPTEDMYDAQEWDKTGAEEKTDEETGNVTMLPLYGKVIALGVNVQDENSCWVPEAIATADARQHQRLVYLDPEDLEDADLSYFRFVNVGDSAYALQNKATGLFIDLGQIGTGAAWADLTPMLFNQEIPGLGINFLTTVTVFGERKSYMHAQHATMTACAWTANSLGCNSMFMIHEVGDVTAEPTTEFKKEVEAGKVYTFCYATEFSAGEGGQLYDFKGINVAADTAVVLTPITTVAAGRPVVYIADGDYEEPGEEVETETATFTRGAFAPVANPVEMEAAIAGTFRYGQTVGKGTIIPSADGFKATTTSSTSVEVYTAIMDWEGTVEVAAGDIRIPLKGKLVDAIEDVISTVAQSGAIYSVDGKLLQKNGNINNVAKFGKGMYIVNGVKVLVK